MPRPQLRVLLPGVSKKWFSGGQLTSIRLVEVLRPDVDVELVTYVDHEPGLRHLDAVLSAAGKDDALYIAGFGYDLEKLVVRLKDRRLIHWANSYGWGFVPSPSIPILAASPFTLGLWADQAPGNFIAYLPNPVMEDFRDVGAPRDIDVAVSSRKAGTHLTSVLSELRQRGVEVTTVEDRSEPLPELFQRTKVYLYDSRDYWAKVGVTEGFGLPPVEAFACGCKVFTSLNAGLSTIFDPGLVGEKVGVYSAAFDAERIIKALATPAAPVDPSLLAEFRPPAIRARWSVLEPALVEFFQYRESNPQDVSYADVGARRYARPIPPLARRIKNSIRSRIRLDHD